ncbi:hypothetical protein CVS40_11894 [Lucilia cuprina]|nr:hypothetical protein CVS40_11894 [Lucilia cuprina]
MSVDQLCICTGCNINISKKSGAIQCTMCDSWCHLKCANVNKDEMKLIKNNSKLGFFCGNCQDDDDVSSSINSKNEIKALRKEVKSGFEEINKNFKNMLEQMNATFSLKISELRSDIDFCHKNNKATESKVSQLEIDNNVLHKRLNRCDIIATGMSHSNNIMETIKSLGEFLDVTISDNDIQQCCFINKKGKILIKFNSVKKKDLLMEKYFKYGKLKLSDFVKNDDNNELCNENDKSMDVQESTENDSNGQNVNRKQKPNICDINSRVYLNDNLTPIERKLSYFCRNLKRTNKISKFQLLHNNIPKVKIVMPDGSNKYFSIKRGNSLLCCHK